MVELKDTLANRYALGETLADDLFKLFEPINYPKHAFMVQQRVMSDCIFYVRKGLAREFYTFDGLNDEDNTTQFVREGDFYFCISSFLKDKPADCYTQILEPVKAYILTKEVIESHKDSSFILTQFINQVFKDCLIRQSDRINIFMKSRKTAERYTAFIDQNPDLANRLSDKLIASYLGINSSTLSRIRGAAS